MSTPTTRWRKGQRIKGGYEYQQIDRRCDGSWISCADAPKTRENTLRAEWRANMVENLERPARVCVFASGASNYDENAFLSLVPMANVVPAGGATVSAYQYLQQTGLTGFGPVAGFPTSPLTGNAAIFSPNNNILPQALYGSRNNINEEVGMRRFNMADRNRTSCAVRSTGTRPTSYRCRAAWTTTRTITTIRSTA